MDFDLQRFLSEMHAENKESIRTLTEDVHEGFDEIRSRSDTIARDLVLHEKNDITIQVEIQSRLRAIEKVLSNGKWFFRVGIAAVITFLLDMLAHHNPMK